jgi:glycerol-3-phosphate acyltransferase PlsY
MTTLLLSVIAVVVAYLIGAIPFGFLIAKAIKGVDVRTIGSGNIGATNVARALGFKFFPVVFALDAAKGYLPTFFFPRLVEAWTGSSVPDLPPFVALATILGHNFPIYLGFKGGKGAATSLGAVFALDPVAGVFAVCGFVVVLVFTRFVSLASIGGGLFFMLTYFARTPEPFARDHRTMSAMIIGLMALLIARHRTNLARIAAGTEPKVRFRKRREGKVRVGLVALLVVVAAGTGLALNASRRPELTVAGRRLVEVNRFAPGQQRAERLAFVDGGKYLVATCPRYLRAVLAHVTDSRTLELVADIDVGGRAVAVAPGKDRFTLLVRPHGDARHLEEAWWQSYDLAGNPIGSRIRIGWDPDDFAFSEDGRLAYVLTSGRAEGETNRPAPALIVFDLSNGPPTPIGRVSFDDPKDDPERLAILTGGRAAVSLRGPDEIARLDLSDPKFPKLIDRLKVPDAGIPLALAVDSAGRVLVGDPDASAFWRLEGDRLVQVDVDGGVADLIEAEGYVLATLPRGSGVAVLTSGSDSPLGTLSIRGTANLGTTRPLGIAYSPERKLLAVSNRAGGSLHLIAVE